MLLHVEKQVATFASRIEVWDLAQPLQLNARAVGGQIAAESTDVIGCACVAMRSNEFTRLDYVPSRKLAVEAQPHESSRPQSRQQGSPSDKGVGHMMQDSNRFDHVKRARDLTELENVSLCILNVRDSKLPRFSFGIADTA